MAMNVLHKTCNSPKRVTVLRPGHTYQENLSYHSWINSSIATEQEIRMKENIHDFHILLSICGCFLADLLVCASKQIKTLVINICKYFLAN